MKAPLKVIGERWAMDREEVRGKVLPLRRQAAGPDATGAAPGGAAMSDEALVAACGVGDSAALGMLFDRHHEAVYRFLSRLVRATASEADDLVQITFLEVWRSAGRFGGKGAVKSWIFGVAANVARHHVRGEVRRRVALAEAAEGGGAPASSSAVRSPDEAAMRAQLVDRVGVAMATLSHELRVAFIMCDLEDVPGVEAARVLGVREGTLWRRLHDARKALRAALGGGVR
jgi:RNA polymerase sigma-70 factor (ECF subfamily)